MRPWLAALAILVSGLTATACGTSQVTSSGPQAGAGTASAQSSRTPSPTRPASPGAQASNSDAAASKQRAAPVFDVHREGDIDTDGATGSRGLDADDDYLLRFGPSAKPTDRAAIDTLLERYFAALAGEQDSLACSLMSLTLENLIPETYSLTSPSQEAGRGMTCAAVLSKIFAGHHRELADESRRLRVTAVRVRGNSALVILRFAPRQVRRVTLAREAGVWKVNTLQAVRLG